MSSQNIITRHVLVLFLANIFTSLFGFLRQIYIARILDPADFGVWNLLTVILGYVHYLDFGSNTGMLYETPKYVGKGNIAAAQKVQQQTYVFTWLLIVFFSGLLLILSWLPIHFTNEYGWIMRLTVFAVVVFSLLNFYTVEARIRERFKLLSVSMVIGSFFSLAFTYLIVFFFDNVMVDMIAYAWVGGMAIATLYLIYNLNLALTWPLDLKVIKKVIWTGFPLSLIPIGFTLFQSVDRWVLASVIDLNELGFYALGATMGIFIYMLPSTLATVLSTRLIQRFGRTADPSSSKLMVMVSVWVSSYGMSMILGAVIIIIPMLLSYLLPAYQEGVLIISIVVIANGLLFAIPVTSNFLLSVGYKKWLYLVLFVMTILEIFVIYIGATYYGGVGGAYALLLSDFIFCFIVSFLVIGLLGNHGFKRFKILFDMFVPFIICLSISGFIIHNNSLKGELWGDAVSSLYFLFAYFSLSALCLTIYAWLSGLKGGLTILVNEEKSLNKEHKHIVPEW